MRSMVVLGTQERPTQRRTEPRQPVRLAVCGHPGHEPGLPWHPPKTSPRTNAEDFGRKGIAVAEILTRRIFAGRLPTAPRRTSSVKRAAQR